MTDIFDFVEDNDLRKSLTQDWIELQNAFQGKLWKICHVLSGSIIESVLINFLIELDESKKNEILSISLGTSIDQCHKRGVISDTTKQLAIVIRDFRNLIHPGRQIRLEQSTTKESANICINLVSMILNEVQKSRVDRIGLTAEQLANKIISDPSCVKILKHFIDGMKDSQLTQFVMHVAPQKYDILESEQKGDTLGITDNFHKINAIKNSLNIVYGILSQNSKMNKSKSTIKILREGSEDYIIYYMERFFISEEVQFFSDAEFIFFEDYIMNAAKNQINSVALQIISQTTEYISTPNIINLIESLVHSAIYAKNEKTRKIIQDFLENFQIGYDEKHCKEIDKFLKDWRDLYSEGKMRDFFNKIIDNRDVIPF
ncbi:hypothetical protein KXR53_04860 [Inquilinus limosus]|uniref:hypothetical protein n=1 Tax=Inquilinus limosus TaxID=171674 RepID=UPI003F16710A